MFQYNHDTSKTCSLNFGGSDTHTLSQLPGYIGSVALYSPWTSAHMPRDQATGRGLTTGRLRNRTMGHMRL